MLPHVDARAHSALSVHKVLEGEAEVGGLRMMISPRLLHALEWLDKPFPEADKLSTEQGSFYEIVDSFKQEGPSLVRDASLPGTTTITVFF